jgi:hypothetical protein
MTLPPPCWDLLTRVELGTWDLGPHVDMALSVATPIELNHPQWL